MTQEQVYVLMGRIERLMTELQICERHNVTPQFSPEDEALSCGEYAEQIYGYVRANNDEKAMIDCCKINRYYCYKLGKYTDAQSEALRKAGHYLYKIHNLALERIWRVSKEDIENDTYYINSLDGLCRNTGTDELLPKPEHLEPEHLEPEHLEPESSEQPEPESIKLGLPSCFDTPEARQIFQNAVDGGLLTPNNYQPTKNATKGRLAIFATELGKRLNIGDFNAKCERLWGKKHLAQAYQNLIPQKNFDDLETEIKQYFITEE